MAHSLSAKKRIRQNEKRRSRNRARKDLLKVEVKAFNSLLSGGKLGTEADQQLSKVVSRLDKTAAKHTIHKNTAARKRSRLARKLNALRAKKTTAGAGTGGAKA